LKKLLLVSSFVKVIQRKISLNELRTVVYYWVATACTINSSLFNEFVCKLGSLLHEWVSLKAHECHKEPNPHTNELNTTFFCSTSPLVSLSSCDIYQNPFTQEKIPKFWQCRTKKIISSLRLKKNVIWSGIHWNAEMW
jgi:hypothetical protein